MHIYLHYTYSLINIFVQQNNLKHLADNLHAYRCELKDLELRDTDFAIYGNSSKAKPQKLIPKTIMQDFFKKSMSLLMDLPLALPISLAHLPLYLISRHSSKHEVYEEVKAQDKVLHAKLVVPIVYLFLFLWQWYYLYRFTFFGLFFAIATIGIFFWLHIVSIDRKYEQFKQWKGAFQLFDAFVLKRGLGSRKKRILEVMKIRNAIQNDLQQIFNHVDLDEEDSLDIKLIKRAIQSRVG